MKLVIVGGKLAASGAIVAGAVAFLVFFGPRATPAFADIYAPLANAAGFLSPPPGGGPPLRVGKTLVNGQTFHYAIGHSKLRLDDVLAHYEQQFRTAGALSGRAVSTAARVQGRGAGVVSGVRFGPLMHPRDLSDRLRRFAETTRLKEFGQFHVVSAYAQQGTVFIDFTPGDDVQLNMLLPAGSADAPGEDLQGVRRPEGLQRLLTIEHGEGATWSRTLIYRTRDSAAAVVDFRRALQAAGWAPNAMLESPTISHHTDGRRECFLAGGGLDQNGVVILVHRMLSGPQRTS